MRVYVLIAFLIATLISMSAQADSHVVTYIEYEGRFIELTDSWYPANVDVPGVMMAVEANDISTTENYRHLDNLSVAVHAWKHDGDWVVVYFVQQGSVKRFHQSVVKTIVVDRPFPVWKPGQTSRGSPA